jgi:hypothetical protein
MWVILNWFISTYIDMSQDIMINSLFYFVFIVWKLHYNFINEF